MKLVPFIPDHRFLVTGASSGIGRALALHLVARGASVVASGRDVPRLEAMRASAADPARVVLAPRDLSADVPGLVDWVAAQFREGPPAGLVHSAGVLATTPLRVLSVGTLRKVMDVNFFSFLALARGLVEAGLRDGALVAISSVASLRGLSGAVAYSGTKGALNAAVRALAVELAPLGVRVNAVLPGVVETEMTADVDREQLDYLLAQQFLSGAMTPGDLSGMVDLLLSHVGRLLTGQCVPVDAGCGEIPGPRPSSGTGSTR